MVKKQNARPSVFWRHGVAAVMLAGCGFPELPPVAQLNGRPVAMASISGPTMVKGGAQVTIDGSGSKDPDDDALTFVWTQTAGPLVAIDDPSAEKITFAAPEQEGTVVLALVVNDGIEDSERSLAELRVEYNTTPVADAGEPVDTHNLQSVTLKGTGEDKDGDSIAAYAWSVDGVPVGASYTISATDTAYPVFTPLGKGQFTLSLRVSDGKVWSTKVPLIVTARNNPPTVSVAYPLVQTTNTFAVALTSTVTDADSDAITDYEWLVLDQPSGSSFSLLELNDAATFTPTGKGTYTVGIRAFDGADWSPYTSIKVAAANAPPSVAIPPAQQNLSIDNLSSTFLTANANDPDGDFLTYSWSVVSKPGGSGYDLQSGVASPSFRPIGKGNYVISLVVSDGLASSAPAQVNVTANNLAPSAVAGGPYTGLTAGKPFTVSGVGSGDPDGDTLTYSWRILSDSTLYSGQSPTIVAPGTKGAATLELTISDGAGGTDIATAQIDVNNLAPIGVPTAATAVDAESVAQLFSNQSYDPDGTTSFSYRWTQTDGPTVTLSNANVAAPTFTAPDTPEDVVFTLEVSDGQAWSDPTELRVRTRPIDTLSVFVSGDSGDDANPGTRDYPMKSITAAIDAAFNTLPKKSVAVASAATGYTEYIVMKDGVDLYGGFSTDAAWDRDTTAYETVLNTVPEKNYTVVVGGAVTTRQVVIDGFRINTGAGSATYPYKRGVYIGGSADLRNNRIYVDGSGAPSGGQASGAYVYGTGAYYVTIQNNFFDGGINLSSSVAIVLSTVGANTIVRNNVIRTRARTVPSGMATNLAITVSGSDSTPLIDGNKIEVNGTAPMVTCGGIWIDTDADAGVKIVNNFCRVNSNCQATSAVGGGDNYGGPGQTNACVIGRTYSNSYPSPSNVRVFYNTFIGTRLFESTPTRRAVAIEKSYGQNWQVFSNYFQTWTYITANNNGGWDWDDGPTTIAPLLKNNIYTDYYAAHIWYSTYGGQTLRYTSGQTGSENNISSSCTFADTTNFLDADYYQLIGGACRDRGYNPGYDHDGFGLSRPYDDPQVANPYANSDASDVGWSEHRP